jgi:hypothetical protein
MFNQDNVEILNKIDIIIVKKNKFFKLFNLINIFKNRYYLYKWGMNSLA